MVESLHFFTNIERRSDVMVKHEIRTKGGGTKIVELTACRAIKYQCAECMGFVVSGVKGCTNPLCSLYPFRLGKVPGHKGKGNASSFTKRVT